MSIRTYEDRIWALSNINHRSNMKNSQSKYIDLHTSQNILSSVKSQKYYLHRLNASKFLKRYAKIYTSNQNHNKVQRLPNIKDVRFYFISYFKIIFLIEFLIIKI